jgi:ribonuclease HI
MPYYAVANGINIGIFMNWNDCFSSIGGYKNAKYKKFETNEEAEQFISTHTSIHNNFQPNYYVYTDGACSNNGKNNAQAGIGIFFGINDERNVAKKINGKQTNNTAELSAIIETYYIIENDILEGKKIAIVSDSEYAIHCTTSYGEKQCKQNWIKNIPNKELVKKAYELYKDKSNIKFIHVKAHTSNTDIHSIGNYNADKLANVAIGFDKCPHNSSKSKIYLDVPFSQKEIVKQLGGMWDKHNKKWFIYDNNKNKDHILITFKQGNVI